MGNNAKIQDINLIIQAGIDPKTGLPIKMKSSDKECLKSNMKRALRIIDEQDYCNKGKWYNLPCNISSNELMRMLYYNPNLTFFYMEQTDEFYFMPYALDAEGLGTGIDFYGRFRQIHPVPYTNGSTDAEKKIYKTQADMLSQLKLKCVYGVKDPSTLTYEDLTKSCVILTDRTYQSNPNNNIARSVINDGIVDVMAEMIPLMRTGLIASSGVKGVRVNDGDQSQSVKDASESFENSALTGNIWLPIVGNIEMQELTDGNVAKAQDYLMALQGLDNLRLSTHGLESGGVFEKKSHTLEKEQAMNASNTGLVMQDTTSVFQNFCNIVNSIWGLGIWYEPSENIVGDLDGDSVAYDTDQEQMNSGSSNEEVENNDEL